MIKPNNDIQLIGYLGSDPESKQISEELMVVNFSLATDDGYKNAKGEKVEKTNWHKIVAWPPLADVVLGSLKKGSKILVRGALEYRNFNDKDGKNVTMAEIVAGNIHFL